jgi:MYXO-CTERM domain-containing protein
VPQNDLCPAGQLCTDGQCVTGTPIPPVDPGTPAASGGEPAGCGCTVGGESPTSAPLFLGVALALGLAVRRKRS